MFYAVPIRRECTFWAVVEADSIDDAVNRSDSVNEDLPAITNWEQTGEMEIDESQVREVYDGWELGES